MYRTKVNRIFQSLVLIALVTLAVTSAFAFDNTNGPDLPEECSSIRVSEGNKLAFHAYAKGVQIYKWNLITQKWDLLAPQAGLFAEDSYFGEIGSHYAGPTWESKSGSKVEGRRVLGTIMCMQAERHLQLVHRLSREPLDEDLVQPLERHVSRWRPRAA